MNEIFRDGIIAPCSIWCIICTQKDSDHFRTGYKLIPYLLKEQSSLQRYWSDRTSERKSDIPFLWDTFKWNTVCFRFVSKHSFREGSESSNFCCKQPESSRKCSEWRPFRSSTDAMTKIMASWGWQVYLKRATIHHCNSRIKIIFAAFCLFPAGLMLSWSSVTLTRMWKLKGHAQAAMDSNRIAV